MVSVHTRYSTYKHVTTIIVYYLEAHKVTTQLGEIHIVGAPLPLSFRVGAPITDHLRDYM
jgi:hypothetical protein